MKKYIMRLLATALAVVAFTYTCWSQPVTGVASWYGERYRGRPTASGEIYNPDKLTAAHRTLPFGTIVRCTYQNKSVVVKITDRGPFVKGRIIDLSKAAFAKLAPTSRGLIKIKLEIINK